MEPKLTTAQVLAAARKNDSDRKKCEFEKIAQSAVRVIIEPLTLDPGLQSVVHPTLARECSLVPIGFEHGNPVIAMADPHDFSALESLLRQLPNCVVVSAEREHVQRAIAELYW